MVDFDYGTAIQDGYTPEQINNYMFRSGRVRHYQDKPEWWENFSFEDRKKVYELVRKMGIIDYRSKLHIY